MAAAMARRGLLRAAASRAAPAAAPRLALAAPPAAAPAWRPVGGALAAGARPYVSVMKHTRDEVLERLDNFHAEVLSTNWADYLNLVYDVPFWEAELEKLTSIVQPYLHEPAVGEKFAKTQEMMDVLYQCEDVRDHLNELAELCTRASGFMGTGYAAEEKVENMDDNAKACSEMYEALLKKHPEFKPKIEQTVGHGLAVLRAKHKFKFGSMHRYFY